MNRLLFLSTEGNEESFCTKRKRKLSLIVSYAKGHVGTWAVERLFYMDGEAGEMAGLSLVVSYLGHDGEVAGRQEDSEKDISRGKRFPWDLARVRVGVRRLWPCGHPGSPGRHAPDKVLILRWRRLGPHGVTLFKTARLQISPSSSSFSRPYTSLSPLALLLDKNILP